MISAHEAIEIKTNENLGLITNIHAVPQVVTQAGQASNLAPHDLKTSVDLPIASPFILSHINSVVHTPGMRILDPPPKITQDADLYEIVKNGNKYTKVTDLELKNNHYVTNRGLQRFLSKDETSASELESVDLSGCSNVDDTTIQLLADAPLDSTTFYKRLSVEHCLAVTNKGIENMLASKNFERLEYLNIGRCDDIDDEGIIKIANSPSMQSLVEFHCHKIYLMSNVGLLQLGNSKNFKNLVKLNLSNNQGIDDKGLIDFVKSPLMKQLRSLNINSCKSITTVSLIELVRSENNVNLKTLKMIDILADRAFDNAIAETPYLNKLQNLHLTTNIDMEAFLKSEKAKKISLEISEHFVKEKEVKKLQKYRKEKKGLRKITLTGPKNAQLLKHGHFLHEVESLTLATIKKAEVFKTIFASIDEDDRNFIDSQLSARGGSLKSHRVATVTDLQQSLESSSQLSKLEILQISSCPDLEDEAIETLTQFFYIRSYQNLRVIRFYDVKLKDKTLNYLARAKLNGTLDIIVFDKITGLTSGGIRGLVASPICESVKKLKLQNFPVDENAIKYISSSTILGKLQTLKLKNVDLTITGLSFLLASVTLKSLKTLSIKKNEKLDKDCADKIANCLLNISTLKLDLENRIPVSSWKLLAEKASKFIEVQMNDFKYNPNFFFINSEYKSRNNFGLWAKSLDNYTINRKEMKETMSDIGRSMNFFSHPGIFITHLTIVCASNSDNNKYQIGCDVVGEIISQPQLISVTHFEISDVAEADDLFSQLCKARFLKTFTSLVLEKCMFDDKKALPEKITDFFAASQNIIKIKVSNCLGFTDEFVKVFINELPKLTSIDFETLKHITNLSLSHISASNKSKVLKHLRFFDCDSIKDDGMKYLTTNEKLERLTKIDIDECDMITHETTKSVLSCSLLPRMTEYKFNRKVNFDSDVIKLVMNIPMKNLYNVKIEFTEIEKQYMNEVLKQPEGTRKDMLFKMAFNDNTIQLIDDDIFAQLLDMSKHNKKYLRFCCSLPSKVTNPRLTADSVHKLICKYKEAELDLDVNELLDMWSLLINEDVLLEMINLPKLRDILTQKDFGQFRSLQKESIKKFLEKLQSADELINFMNKNTLEVDDDIFKAITDNPNFVGISSLNFKAFHKLTPSGIKYIFTSKNSTIKFTSYLETSGLSKELLEAEVIVAAFNSHNFDLDSFNPDEYPNLTVGNADFFFDKEKPKTIRELILRREWMGQNPLNLLDRRFNFPNLKVIRFSNAPSRKCALLLRDFFQSDHFIQIEEAYLDNLTLTESFFEKLTLKQNGKLKTFSLKNIQIATVENVNYTSFALSNVLKNVKNFTFTNVKPTDPLMIYKLSTGQFDFDYLEYGDIRTSAIQDFDKACETITTEKTFAKLKHLRLVNIPVTDRYLKMMADSTTLKNLEVIDFDRLDGFTLEGFQVLLKSNVMLKITMIKLNLIMDSTWLKAIANSDKLVNAKSFIFKARDENGATVNLDEGMKEILLATQKLPNLDVYNFLIDNKELVNDEILSNGLGESTFKQTLKQLNLLHTKISSNGLVPVLTGLHKNTDFQMKEFLNSHKECAFIDNEVYNLLIRQDPTLDEIFFTGRFVGVKPQAKLKEFFDNEKINAKNLSNFLEKYAEEFDNEGINILCRYPAYLRERKISIKLTNQHVMVTKDGLENLLKKIVVNFSMDYDWILNEARWRKLLTKEGLQIIARADQKEFAYVDTLDFSENNYLTSVGYHKMIAEFMQEFYKEIGIQETSRMLNPMVFGATNRAAEIDIEDLEAQRLEISEAAVLEDTKDFLDSIAKGRVNWDRIIEDDEVGKNFLLLIQKCNFVRVLKLDDKNIGDDIVKALSRQIWQLTIEGKCFLEEISLKNNPRITSVGMKYLYTALVGNNTVQTIDVSCDENIKLEYNKLVNNGVKYTIVEKMREYVRKYREKKRIRFYDKYCKYILLYTIICLPFACFQYHEDRIMKRLKTIAKNNIIAKCIFKCLKKKKKRATHYPGKAGKLVDPSKPHEQHSVSKKESRELFVFNVNMINLNFWLSQRKIWILFFINWILYYSACILPPVLQKRDCDSTINLFGLFFVGYAIFAFFLELWIFKNICKFVDNPDIVEFKWITALFNVFMSQLSKAAFYTNITFVMSQWNCYHKDLSVASAVFVILNSCISLIFILPKLFRTMIFFCRGRSTRSSHTTKFINKMCKLAFHLEFLTISKTLERFATSSSIKIRKQYFPQVMIGAFMKFFIGDTPQVVLKIINLIRSYSTWVDIGSPVLNMIKIIQSFNIAMEAKPSVCRADMIKALVDKREERAKNLKEIESFMRGGLKIHTNKKISPIEVGAVEMK